MKNPVFILFLLLTATMPLKAQQYQLDSIVNTINGHQFIEAQKYNSEKKYAELTRYEKNKSSKKITKSEKVKQWLDKNDNEILFVFSSLNLKTNRWEELEKTETAYDANKQLIQKTTFRKQEEEKDWQKAEEFIKTFVKDTIITVYSEIQGDKFQPIEKNKTVTIKNTYNKTERIEAYTWNIDNENWINTFKTINLFKNDTISIGNETYEWADNKWQNKQKTELELDKSNNTSDTNYTGYISKNSTWIPDYKYEKIDFPSENKTIRYHYKWSEKENSWFLTSRSETFFDKKGEIQKWLEFNLDTVTNQLKLDNEIKYINDTQGRLILNQTFTYNNDKIASGFQSSVTFDDDGNMLNTTDFEYDTKTNQWKETYLTQYFFDKNIVWNPENKDKSSDYFRFYDFYEKNKHAVKKIKTYGFETGKQTLNQEYDYFYSIKK